MEILYRSGHTRNTETIFVVLLVAVVTEMISDVIFFPSSYINYPGS